jgi:hypothetical protein
MGSVDVASSPDCTVTGDSTVHVVALSTAGTAVDVHGKQPLGRWDRNAPAVLAFVEGATVAQPKAGHNSPTVTARPTTRPSASPHAARWRSDLRSVEEPPIAT